MMKKIDISILGLGNLGTAFFEGLHKNSNVNLHLYEEMSRQGGVYLNYMTLKYCRILKL